MEKIKYYTSLFSSEKLETADAMFEVIKHYVTLLPDYAPLRWGYSEPLSKTFNIDKMRSEMVAGSRSVIDWTGSSSLSGWVFC